MPISVAPNNSVWLLRSDDSPLKVNKVTTRTAASLPNHVRASSEHPPSELVVLVGFLHHSNGRSCSDHDSCGEALVIGAPNLGVGMRLRLVHSGPNEIAAHIIMPDNSNGCRVAFAQRQYTAGNGPALYDGAIVSIAEMYTAHHENSACRRLGHHNYGYAPAQIIEFAKKKDRN